mmetsp:Transcript_31546/g.74016  ORF Transcript_31546/g.74016 Transcript_31546/m.74016 type:complete len:264 (-) Transcript_31546:20-811(-)
MGSTWRASGRCGFPPQTFLLDISRTPSRLRLRFLRRGQTPMGTHYGGTRQGTWCKLSVTTTATRFSKAETRSGSRPSKSLAVSPALSLSRGAKWHHRTVWRVCFASQSKSRRCSFTVAPPLPPWSPSSSQMRRLRLESTTRRSSRRSKQSSKLLDEATVWRRTKCRAPFIWSAMLGRSKTACSMHLSRSSGRSFLWLMPKSWTSCMPSANNEPPSPSGVLAIGEVPGWVLFSTPSVTVLPSTDGMLIDARRAPTRIQRSARRS